MASEHHPYRVGSVVYVGGWAAKVTFAGSYTVWADIYRRVTADGSWRQEAGHLSWSAPVADPDAAEPLAEWEREYGEEKFEPPDLVEHLENWIRQNGHPLEPPLECTNCGVIVTKNMRKARCTACYTYLHRNGEDRPFELVERHFVRLEERHP